jgi:N-acetylglucosamine-6-phosphate deacetylase
MASLYPAKALGLAQQLGSIAPGMAPGLLLMSKNGNVEVFL